MNAPQLPPGPSPHIYTIRDIGTNTWRGGDLRAYLRHIPWDVICPTYVRGIPWDKCIPLYPMAHSHPHEIQTESTINICLSIMKFALEYTMAICSKSGIPWSALCIPWNSMQQFIFMGHNYSMCMPSCTKITGYRGIYLGHPTNVRRPVKERVPANRL